MTEEGAFPLEMERGRRATHYQNYALLYLIPIMEITARQGYDVYEMEIDAQQHIRHDEEERRTRAFEGLSRN